MNDQAKPKINYISRIASSFSRLWNTREGLSFRNIKKGNVKLILGFPLVIVFIAVFYYGMNSEFSLNGVGSDTLFNLFFSIGALVMICMKERHLPRLMHAAMILSAIGLAGFLMMPTGQEKTLSVCLNMLGCGGVAICAFYLFCIRLNNAERLIGTLLMVLALNIGFCLGGVDIDGIVYAVILLAVFSCMAVCCFSLRFDKAVNIPQNPSASRPGSTNLFMVYALPFFIHNQLMNEYLSASDALVMPEYIFATLIAMAISIILQVAFKLGVWHMWNTVLILAILGNLFLWIQDDFSIRLGRFLLNIESAVCWIAFFYMLSGIIKLSGGYGFYRNFLAVFFGGLIVAIGGAGLLVAAWPQSTLIILTAYTGIMFITLILLTPMLSKRLFMQRWVESFRGFDISFEEVSGQKELVQALFGDFQERLKTLTPTEMEVYNLIKQGKDAKEICKLMFISPNTLKTHNTHIYSKMDVVSRDELSAYIRMMQKAETVSD